MQGMVGSLKVTENQDTQFVFENEYEMHFTFAYCFHHRFNQTDFSLRLLPTSR